MRALPDSRRLTETMLKTCLLQVQVCCAMQIEYLIRFYWIQRFLNNGAYKSLYFIDNRLIFVIEWQGVDISCDIILLENSVIMKHIRLFELNFISVC